MAPTKKSPFLPFVGREHELDRLKEIDALGEAALVLVYGRRRVGKTTLIEEALGKRKMLKFEGLEGQPESRQQLAVLEQFASATGNSVLKTIQPRSWREVLQILTEYIKKGVWTVFFEELQWLCAYRTELVAELKFFWDNEWRKNPGLIAVLCGSSPSFMIGGVVQSKALHNRSLHEIPVMPFTPHEAADFMGSKNSPLEIINALLLVGGIPEYLKYLRGGPSVYLAIAKNSFVPGGFFLGEYERIFVSNLAQNPHYREVVRFLSGKRYATRDEIASSLKLKSGSNLTRVLEDLELCGFISRFTPFDKTHNSTLGRYEIADPYIQFYNRMIRPKRDEILQKRYTGRVHEALPLQKYEQWLGYGLERFCRRNAHLIAKKLGFGAVEYSFGPYFSRRTQRQDPGFQIDLVFRRADRVFTLCEIKHNAAPVNQTVVDEVLKKFSLMPVPGNYTVQRVLLLTGEVTPEVKNHPAFDAIVKVQDFLFQ